MKENVNIFDLNNRLLTLSLLVATSADNLSKHMFVWTQVRTDRTLVLNSVDPDLDPSRLTL